MEITLCMKILIVISLLFLYCLFFGWGVYCLVQYRMRKKSIKSETLGRGITRDIVKMQEEAAYTQLVEDNLLGWSAHTYLAVVSNAFLAVSAIIGFILS